MKYIISYEEKIDRILKNQILLYNLIFELPEPNNYYNSPFRQDDNPGCYFNLYNNKIYFIDWGDDKIRRDIFEFTKDLYSLTFYDSVNTLFSLLNNNLNVKLTKTKKKFVNKTSSKREIIQIKKRYFNNDDIDYWKQYSLTLHDLCNTNGNFKIVPISKFKMVNIPLVVIPTTIAYAYQFETGQKTYIPHSIKYKWRNSIHKNDIGKSTIKSNTITITKSVKDALILNKLGFDYGFFQSESSFPEDKIIENLIKPYDKINILFDNDATGIKMSIKLYNYLKLKSKKVKNIIPPEKDISDTVKKYDLEYAKHIILQN